MSNEDCAATCRLAVWETHRPRQREWEGWLQEEFGRDHDVLAWWAHEIRSAARKRGFVAGIVCMADGAKRRTLQVVSAGAPQDFPMIGLFALDAFCREAGIDRDLVQLRLVIAEWAHGLEQLQDATARLHLQPKVEVRHQARPSIGLTAAPDNRSLSLYAQQLADSPTRVSMDMRA